MITKSINYCIKNINGKQYLYSWVYRPKHLRTPRKKQRYVWKYIGSINGKKTQKFISKLPAEDKRQIEMEFRLKQEEYEKQRGELKEKMLLEPYYSRMIDIMKIANRNKRNKELKRLEEEIKSVI